MQAIPGVIEAELFGFGEQDITYDLDVYMSRVLEKYFAEIIDLINTDPFSIPINYNEGMMDVMNRMMKFLDLDPPAEYLNKMRDRIQYHGKHPGQIFQEEKSQSTPPEYLNNCFELYNRMEEKRITSLQTSRYKPHQFS
jgi:hypothetical protein